MRLTVPTGSIALDGEREMTFSPHDYVYVTLREAAFRTIDVAACLAHAAASRCLVEAEGRSANLKHHLGGCQR
jgi:hypothetical protein